MKSLAVGFCVGTLLFASAAFAQTSTAPDAPPDMTQAPVTPRPAATPLPPVAPAPAMSANEAAGLPNLEAINRPAAEVTSKVELNTVREPSFHTRDRSGTEVTEYRDRGKPTEIDVRSNFGTRYQMSNPTDVAPRVPNNGAPNGRVPSIRLSY